MNVLTRQVEVETEALGEAFPFGILVDKSCQVAWAGPSVIRRFPDSVGGPLEKILRTEEGEYPSLSLLEETLGKPGRWVLDGDGRTMPLAGTWIRAGSGYLFLARPDPADATELTEFSFRDFPWDDLPILYMTSKDEFRNSLDEVQAMAGLLKKRDAYLQTLLDTIPLGVILIDQETRKITGVNPCALDLIGADAKKVLGRPCSLFCSHLDGVCPYLDEGRPMDKEETIIRRLDGTTIPILKSVNAIEMDGKKYILDSILDIRERKALERRVLQAQKMESVGQLAAGVAHEINTPIQFIGDNLRFLRDAMADLLEVVEKAEDLLALQGGEGPAEFRKCKEDRDLDFFKEEVPAALEQSLEGLKRVGEIVEAMKSFAEPERGVKDSMDVNESLKKALAVCQGQWKSVARVEMDLQEDLPPVQAHAVQLEQTFFILLVNAAQAVGARRKEEGREEKGVIRVRTRNLGDSVEIRVEDEGTGIAEELRNRIFDPFFSTKGVGIGSGRGLAYAHSIVTKAHGGEIFFETEKGKGTTFVVRIPLNSV